jgi:hypothetical protein
MGDGLENVLELTLMFIQQLISEVKEAEMSSCYLPGKR